MEHRQNRINQPSIMIMPGIDTGFILMIFKKVIQEAVSYTRNRMNLLKYFTFYLKQGGHNGYLRDDSTYL